MTLDLYQVDAFTHQPFKGNPACVIPLKDWLPDALLLEITKENAVAETAFFVEKEGQIHLRWFTPEIEMDLCGHATLATAHCLKTILNNPSNKIIFQTCSGELTVLLEKEFYFLDFPSRKPVPVELPPIIEKALNLTPKEVFKSRDYVLVYDTEQEVKNIQINRLFFDQINLNQGGVIVTAKGDKCDFVSRFFTPRASVFEDPVTGSAHCTLIPLWSEKLGKKKLQAVQLSERTGKLFCQDREDRVIIGGQARTYSIGKCFLTES